MSCDAEAPRLYSRISRCPVDIVAAQHQPIHEDLERWGAWNRERYQQGTCDSIESQYDETGGRKVRKPMIALPVNPRNGQLDSVVRNMVMRVPQHGECIRLFYVRRSPLTVICRALVLRWEDFPTWMFDSRAMVINILRQLGLADGRHLTHRQ